MSLLTPCPSPVDQSQNQFGRLAGGRHTPFSGVYDRQQVCMSDTATDLRRVAVRGVTPCLDPREKGAGEVFQPAVATSLNALQLNPTSKTRLIRQEADHSKIFNFWMGSARGMDAGSYSFAVSGY